MAATEFDADTALAPSGDGTFTGTITDRWMIGGGPNGGYIASLLLRAVMASSAQPDPISLTTHYVGRPEQGPCTVAVSVTQQTKSHVFLQASLIQQGTVRAHAIAVMGQRRDDQPFDTTMTTSASTPPGVGVPVRETGTGDGMPMMSFLDRFSYLAPNSIDLFAGDGGLPVVAGWTKLVDRDLDELAVPLFADCWPPPMFTRRGPGMAPTIELTVHFRGRPEPGWTWCIFESRLLSGGYVEEDGELWSASGKLIAMSRQISRFTAMPLPTS